MFNFEKLEVWHKAIDFADAVYSITRAFPDVERFGLTSQMRRSAVSISSNIAEGSGRGSDADFAHFIEIAYGSLMEVVSQLQIARQEAFLSEREYTDIYQASDRLARMLSGLRASLTQRNSKRPTSGHRPSTLDARP